MEPQPPNLPLSPSPHRLIASSPHRLISVLRPPSAVLRRLSSIIILIALLSACAPAGAGSDPPRPTPQPTPTFAPITLPADDAPHDVLTEWWYYTGHLFGADGRRYGFELVFFQSLRRHRPAGYAAHFAITDPARARFDYAERSEAKPTFPPTLDLALGDWTLTGRGGNDHLRAREQRYALDLTTQATKPVALHGGNGIVDFGPAGVSYYYSRTRLAVKGTLEVEGQPIAVTGQAWMDHQWGNFIVAGGGWDWYAIQLDDGIDLMLTVLRDPVTGQRVRFGTQVDPEGATTPLTADDFTVAATGTWTSPHSGAIYPSGWRVRLPGRDLDLTLAPTLADQELGVTASAGTTYWEGQNEVTGTRAGRPLQGLAYVELTGYVP